jgi:RNA polymerase sigma factor (sigma-70 family)
MNGPDNYDTILLTKACQDGCKKSTESLYIKFKPDNDKCQKPCWLQDIEDSYHELFLRIQEGKVHYEGKGNTDSFLRNTLKNIHLEQHNKDKLKFQSLQQMENNGIFHPDNHTHHPLKALEIDEVKQILMKTISELPIKSHQAIELVYFDGIPAKQAAESIGCEFRIFRNRLKYALKKLRKKLKQYMLT